MLETVDTEYVHHCSDKSLAKICVSCEIKYKDIFLVLKKVQELEYICNWRSNKTKAAN